MAPAAPPNPVPVEGERDLLSLVDAEAPSSVRMEPFELACLAHPRALTAPEEADRSLAEIARGQEVALGRLLLVRIERDPNRRRAEPLPRVCRPVAPSAELYAPLFREKERGGHWVVTGRRGELLDDLAQLLRAAKEGGAKAADRPRVLVVDDRIVLLALPLEEDRERRRQGE